MKMLFQIPLAVCIMFVATGCDRQSPDAARKISELERKNSEAAQRQLELEQQIEDQKLAAERDAIERERAKIEEDRAAMELQQGEAAAAQEDAIRKRDAELAEREGRLENERNALAEKQDELFAHGQELSERDRELAGREALPFEPVEQRAPVGDYGMFYDSLSSYGSWFETPDYGYVWQPVVVRDSGWRPYSRGRWICSDRGWNWVSEEPFGWATYHYGRWALLRGRGWIWVPGSQWAPCWVSWRQSDSHIGWAPLPPETLAYRNHRWDSSVDTQFNIGPLWFNFVGIRDFGGPIGNRCLPVSGNVTIIGRTNNITNIHIENRQVISGGPRYREISDRIGRPLPFYRLSVDEHSRPGRDPMAMRPRIQGDRLTVAAPNLDAGWNERLQPARIKERMENVTVERDADLSAEITGRYRQSREEGRHLAEQAVAEVGGSGKFDQRRSELNQANGLHGGSRGVAVVPDRSPRDAPARREAAAQVDPRREHTLRPAQAAEVRKESPGGNRPQSLPQARPEAAPAATSPREIAKEVVDRRQREQFQQVQPRQDRQALEAQQETMARRQQEQVEQQRQAQQAREAQIEASGRRQQELAQQQQQRDQQRLAQQAREAQIEALARRQQEQAQQARESQLESMRRTRQEPAPQQPREQPRAVQQPQPPPPVRQETGRQRQEQVQRPPEPLRQAQELERQRTEQSRQQQERVPRK